MFFYSPFPTTLLARDHQATSKRKNLMVTHKQQEERRFLSGLSGVFAPESQ